MPLGAKNEVAGHGKQSINYGCPNKVLVKNTNDIILLLGTLCDYIYVHTKLLI